jgi:hypothetical protein
MSDKHENKTDLSEQDVWKILKSYFDENSLVDNQIESFNDFITFGIQDIIDRESTITIPNYSVHFGQVYIDHPSLKKEDQTIEPLFPMTARKLDINYDANIYVDIKEVFTEYDKKEIKNHTRINIGKIPIMLRSSLCNLTGLSEDESIEKGECNKDPGGYFIVKGNERVIVAQMRGVYNQVFVLRQKTESKYKWIAESRSMSDETGHSVLIQAMMKSDERTIEFSVPYIKDPIPAGVLFKALGFTSDKDITNLIGLDITPAKEFMKSIIRDSYFCQTTDEALVYIAKHSLHTVEEKNQRNYAKQIVDTEILPHLGISSTSKEKACFLARMIRKLLLTNFNMRKEDDRDAYFNKRIENTGILMHDIFRNLFKKFIISIKANFEKRKQRPEIISVITKFRNNITKGLHTCLATGNWVVQKNANYVRTGVSQVLDRMTYTATLSHLRRIIIPMIKEGKNAAIRQIHSTSYGFVCVTGDTLVTLSNNEKIPIKNINESHEVLTVNTENNLSEEPSRIYNIFSLMPKELLEIQAGEKVIKCTPDHPFLVYFNTKDGIGCYWVKAGSLEIGHMIYIKNGDKYTVTPITDKKQIEPELVYDFTTVSENHNFIANDFVTHNCPSECFHPETKILSWNGDIKLAKDIKVDDKLIDENGDPVRVKSTTSGVKKMYTILHKNPEFTNYTVTDNHILTLKSVIHNKIVFCNLLGKYVIDVLDREKICVPHESLGRNISYKTHSFEFKNDAEDFQRKNTDNGIIDMTIEEYLNLSENIRNTLKSFKCNGINWGATETDIDPYMFGRDIENIKNIPKEYLINNFYKRTELLRGIKDSIGNYYGGYYTINHDNEKVLRDIEFLARSLGYSCLNNSGELNIKLDNRETIISDFTLKEEEVQPYVGWQLEGNGRFLLGDFTVTHNTPEGKKVGIVLNLSLLPKITRKIPKVDVRRVLEDCQTFRSVQDTELKNMGDYAAVSINGTIIGYSEYPEDTIKEIKALRNKGLLNREISVTYDIVDNDIKIFSDEGRLVRPLFTLTDNHLNLDKKAVYADGEVWKGMVKKGYIQYIDASEIENSVIAMTPDYLKVQHNDFMEIHPVVMLGIMASIIPFADHSQSPRNIYSSAQSKQALGIPLLSYNQRTDTILHVLHYPQRPLISTKIAEYMHINEMPAGINAIVAIAAYTGFRF